MTTEPARLAGIRGGNFPINRACRAARRINQAKNRTAGNTLFMGIASPARDQALTMSCIVTQFARESLGICRVRGSCMREYDVVNPTVLKIERGLHLKMLDAAPFTVRP